MSLQGKPRAARAAKKDDFGRRQVNVSERGRIRVEPAVLPTGHLAYTGLRLRFKD